MGWSTANEIFDPVAQAMIEEDCSHSDKVQVLSVLIATLQAQDWDTEGESLELFCKDHAVVEAFAMNGIIDRCGQTYVELRRRTYDEVSVYNLAKGHADDHVSLSGRTWENDVSA